MTVLGWLILIVGALIVGMGAQLLMKTDVLPYRWVLTSVAAFIGALACSEWLFVDATPVIEGIAVWPALIGGLAVGIVVDLLAQWYAHQQGAGTQGHGAALR